MLCSFRRKVQADVTTRSFKQDASRPVELKVIADVCLVIDVLGGDFK